MRVEHEAEQLPIAARPAVVARGVDGVAGRIVLDQFDVGDERRPRQSAFEQIVTEDGLGGKAVPHGGAKCPDIVNRLAMKSSFAKQVLMRVGDRFAVRIGARGVGENACKPGGGGAR